MLGTNFLPKCSTLKELQDALEERYHENMNELSKLATRDDFESNRRRTKLLAENDLIVIIKTSIS